MQGDHELTECPFVVYSTNVEVQAKSSKTDKKHAKHEFFHKERQKKNAKDDEEKAWKITPPIC